MRKERMGILEIVRTDYGARIWHHNGNSCVDFEAEEDGSENVLIRVLRQNIFLQNSRKKSDCRMENLPSAQKKILVYFQRGYYECTITGYSTDKIIAAFKALAKEFKLTWRSV